MTAASVLPAWRSLMAHTAAAEQITAFASINYRLSPYAKHPTDPSSLADPARNAVHPDHIHDVLAALHYLQRTYGFGSKYLLIGHSCGATLAMQAVMREWGASEDTKIQIVKPIGVVAVEGIYDFVSLRERHASEPIYRDFLAGAFGADEDDWDQAAPLAYLMTNKNLATSWPGGKLLIVAHSREDKLVEADQSMQMMQALKCEGNDGRMRRDELMWITGAHDQIWKDGEQLAAAIVKALDLLAWHAYKTLQSQAQSQA